MNTQKWILALTALALIGGSAVLLERLKTNQKLGQPGVKLVARPSRGADGGKIGTHTVDLPLRVLDYTSEEVEITRQVVEMLPKDTTYGSRLYTEARQDRTNYMFLNVVLMGTDRSSIHRPELCLAGQGWKFDRPEIVLVPIERPDRYELAAMKLSGSREYRTPEGQILTLRGLYLYWFVADGLITPRHQQRMWWMARDLLKTGVLDRWAYIAYFATCLPENEGATFERMKQFMAASVPEFQLTTGLPARRSRPLTASIQ